MRATRGPVDERGSFIVLYALLVLGLFTMAAVVVDIGAMREEKRHSRTVADLAATAAAGRLNSTGTPLAVCTEAWRYAALNLDQATVPASPCAATFSSNLCLPAVSQSATGVINGRTVTITYPVPDSSPLMKAEISGGGLAQDLSPQDGTDPCSRVGVSVTQTRPSLFGSVTGALQRTTATHSVARGFSQVDGGENVPVLVVLEPHACIALDARSAIIEAFGIGGAPGIIRVDSDGTGANCGRTIDVQGAGKMIAHPGSSGVPGVITHFAVQPRAYDPNDINTNVTTTNNVSGINVIPTRTNARITRDLWDAKYKCLSSSKGCTASTSNPFAVDHIAALTSSSAYGGTGTPVPYSGSNSPASFRVYPTDPIVASQGATCGMMTATVVAPPGNWYVNCPSTLDLRGTLTFEGGDVVFQNGVILRGALTVNGTSAANNRESTVYVRNGSLVKATASSSIVLNRTFAYLRNGMLEATSGGLISWTAPTSGPFEKVALWSESAQVHKLWGGSDMTFKGIFFTPNAAFEMGGNPSTAGAFDVQFVVRTAYTQGNAVLQLRGNSKYGIATDSTTSRLIR